MSGDVDKVQETHVDAAPQQTPPAIPSKFLKPLNILAWILAWDVMLFFRIIRVRPCWIWVLVNFVFIVFFINYYIFLESGPKILTGAFDGNYNREKFAQQLQLSGNVYDPSVVWERLVVGVTETRAEFRILNSLSNPYDVLGFRFITCFILPLLIVLWGIRMFSNSAELTNQFTFLKFNHFNTCMFVILFCFCYKISYVQYFLGGKIPYDLQLAGQPYFWIVSLYIQIKLLALVYVIRMTIVMQILKFLYYWPTTGWEIYVKIGRTYMQLIRAIRNKLIDIWRK